VGEPQDLPPPERRAAPAERRLLWFVLIAAWLALAGWALFAYRDILRPWRLPMPGVPAGTYRAVREIAGPLTVRLDDGSLVRLAGLAAPATADEADRLRSRLAQLAPPGTSVYVEIEPRLAGDEGGLPPASVFLPPPGTRRPLPFPYSGSRLLGQVLVQEGLARVNESELYRYLNEFLVQQIDAAQHRRGLWASK
jgi:hypothetical protein